jgi:MoxR-like ATPase
MALVDGRDFVIPDDVKQLVIPVLAHRIVARGAIRDGQRQKSAQVLQTILDSTPVPT